MVLGFRTKVQRAEFLARYELPNSIAMNSEADVESRDHQ